MPIDFDISGARKAGATDADIAEYFKTKYQIDFDFEGARKSGATDEFIIGYLNEKYPNGSKPTNPPPSPKSANFDWSQATVLKQPKQEPVALQPFNEEQVKAGIAKSTTGINQPSDQVVSKIKVTATPGSKGDKAIKAVENQNRMDKYASQLESTYAMYGDLEAQYKPLADKYQELEQVYQQTKDPVIAQQLQELGNQLNPLADKMNAAIEGSKILEAGLRNAKQLDQINKEENFNFSKKGAAAIKSTANNLVNSTGKLIESIGDIAYNNYIANANQAAGIEYTPDDDNKITDQIARGIDEVYQELNAANMKKVPESYQKYSPLTDKPDADKLLYFGMNATAQLAPTVAMGVTTGGLGAAATGFTMEFGGMYDAFHEPIKQRYIKEGLSEKEAELKADQESALMAAGGGLVIAQLDRFGAMQLINSIGKKALVKKVTQDALVELGEKTGKEAAELAMKRSLTKNLAEFAKGYGKAVGGEALTEPIQELVPAAEQDIYNALTDTETFTKGGLGDKKTWIDAANAGIGALMASSPGGLAAGTSNIVNANSYQQIKSIAGEDQVAKFQSDLQAEVEAGLTTPEQAEEAMQTVQKVQEMDKLIPDNIQEPEKRVDAINLINEKQELEKQIEGKEKALVVPQTERIKEIEAELTSIATGKPVDDGKPKQGYRPKETAPKTSETLPVGQTPLAPADTKPTEETAAVSEQVDRVPDVGETIEEGSTVELEPRIKGGQPRTFEFKDGVWQQKVGNEYTAVSEGVQQEAQDAFNMVGTQTVPIKETTPDQQTEGDTNENQNKREEGQRQDVLEQPAGGVEETAPPVSANLKENLDETKKVSANVNQAEAPVLEEVIRRLPKKGKTGLSIELSTTDPGTLDFPREVSKIPGYTYVTNRDESGNITGVIEVSYFGDEGLSTKPQNIKIVVDPSQRRKGIATKLLKYASDNGIDLSGVRGKYVTSDGAALYNATTKTEQPESPKKEVSPEVEALEKKAQEKGIESQRKLLNIVNKYERPVSVGEEGSVTDKDIDNALKNREAGKVRDGYEPPNQKEEEVDEESGDKTGVKHAETAKIRESMGIPEYEKSAKTQAKLEQQADEALKNKYDINGLITKMERGELPSDAEQVIMGKYIAGLAAKIEKNPTDELIEQAKRAIEASDRIGGSEVARSLAARRNLEPKDDTLMDYFMQDIDLNDGANLTEAQKNQAIKEYEEIKAAKTALEEKLAALQAEYDKKISEAQIKKIPKGKKKTHEEYVKERKAILSDIKNTLNDLKKQTNVTILPYARELVAISPHVAKMVRSYVSEGITNLDEIINKIHEELSPVIPDIKKSDVRSVIAGDYQEKKQTRAEINKQVYEIKQQAKLVEKLEKLQKGIEPEMPERKRVQTNKEIEGLKKQIKENDLNKLHEYKKRLTTQLRNLEADLESGNIKEKEVKPPLKLDKEATVLKDIYIRLKQERERRLLVRKYENMSRGEKAKQAILEVLNVPRTIMSSMDFSAPLRQAVVVTASHPILATKAFGEMFKQAFSQKRFDRWFYEVRDDYRYAAAAEAGLFIADPHDLRLSAKEEAFMNNLAERIPVIGRLIKGSERAYVSYLNKMRWDLYNMYAEQFEDQGKTPYNAPDIYKGLASFINNATGRGEFFGALKGLEDAAPVLNTLMFSPRLVASRINFLNPLYYKKLPKEVRVMALKDLAKFIATGVTTLMLLKLAWGCEGDCEDKECDDCVRVETDPRSTDFGKIRIGDTRWDIWGGYQQYIRVMAQLISGQTKSAQSGELSTLTGQGKFGRTRGDVLLAFTRGKLAPVPSIAVDILAGRTVTGEPVTIKDEAMNHMMPLIVSDLTEVVKDKGVSALFSVGIPATFGVGVSTYKNRHDKYVVDEEETNVSANARGIADQIEKRKKVEKEEKKKQSAEDRQELDKEYKVTESEKKLREVTEKMKNPLAVIITELEKIEPKKRNETLNRWVDIEIAPDKTVDEIEIDEKGNIVIVPE